MSGDVVAALTDIIQSVAIIVLALTIGLRRNK